MRRTLAILFAFLFLTVPVLAQSVEWSIASEPVSDDIWRITLTADVEDGCHIYDMQEYVGGPCPTVITLAEGAGVEPAGEVTIVTPVERYYDDIFEMEIGAMAGKVLFAQDVRLTADGADVAMTVEWMACNDMMCTPPQDLTLTTHIGEAVEAAAESDAVSAAPTAGTTGLWGLILAAILWGLAALVTPCVFPMIPMTVSFFIKGSADKATGRFRALMYGLFIVLLYTLPIAVIILLTRLIGGDAVTADIFNWLATHWLPNILFFIIFMAFAASFFGAFEIVLPSSLVNGSDQQADKRKGLGGVFFLALTLVLVSFSCTGPIVGTVLIKSTSGEFWAPIVTMLAFSITFALPFVLFALFPGVLKKLPRSGSWLSSVKVVLGFVEIALGFKFLSTADQVYHWGLLDREVYLAIWIVCFTMLGFYLLGKLRFKDDSELHHIGPLRLALAIVDFTFVVWMIPGMWGAPLKGLSGYLPPMETQDFVLGAPSAPATSYAPVGGTSVPSSAASLPAAPKYSDVLQLPHGLTGYFDLAEGEAAARQTGKPLFIDFTGHGCVNCREMEARVWSDPRVLQLLRDEFVVCALYTDDKLTVDEANYVVTPDGKTLKTIGKINSYIALSRYGVAAQPNYVIQSPDGGIVCPARGYDLDVEAFIGWLRQGLASNP